MSRRMFLTYSRECAARAALLTLGGVLACLVMSIWQAGNPEDGRSVGFARARAPETTHLGRSADCLSESAQARSTDPSIPAELNERDGEVLPDSLQHLAELAGAGGALLCYRTLEAVWTLVEEDVAGDGAQLRSVISEWPDTRKASFEFSALQWAVRTGAPLSDDLRHLVDKMDALGNTRRAIDAVPLLDLAWHSDHGMANELLEGMWRRVDDGKRPLAMRLEALIIGGEDEATQERAVFATIATPPDETVSILEAVLLADASEVVRECVAVVLSGIEHPAAGDLLVSEACDATSHAVRERATRAIGRKRDDESVRRLRAVVDSSRDEAVRTVAVQLLAGMQESRAVRKALAAILRTNDDPVLREHLVRAVTAEMHRLPRRCGRGVLRDESDVTIRELLRQVTDAEESQTNVSKQSRQTE